MAGVGFKEHLLLVLTCWKWFQEMLINTASCVDNPTVFWSARRFVLLGRHAWSARHVEVSLGGVRRGKQKETSLCSNLVQLE